jgi:hypothetical protein
MRRLLTIIAVCSGLTAATLAQAPAPPPDTAALRAQYERWRTEFKTWGKWAPIGQESRGATNLITPQKVASALRLVRNGLVVSLAHAELQEVAADVAAAGIFHRVTNAITDGGTTDNYQVSYHGQTVAHIDTWCHFFENGQMYNGVPVKDNVTNERGCVKGSVMNWRGGVTTRAVLYDIAQLKGVEYARSHRAGDARGSRSLGKEVRCEDRPRRHSAALHRPVEAPRRARPVDRPGRRLLP